ncbi:tumor necrosis factor receptor superfamily member 6B-like isoform X1 [Scomber scombrus]|uniref:tumor necrosis factor receptor superfamily member 6B-like isoform X1 n=1 Tax=Scomber scombrus TaxID=13677 RepID=UPI002DDAFCB4|nr:tumor necrosis factor receptor superfamily member 6B-like isoform X1 [Scomber scombrus]
MIWSDVTNLFDVCIDVLYLLGFPVYPCPACPCITLCSSSGFFRNILPCSLLSFQMSILLLSVLSLLAVHCSPVMTKMTFTHRDRTTGRQLECDSCPPGTFLPSRCTPTQKSVCMPCPTGSFTALWNYIDRCLRCNVCDYNQVVKKACTAESDIECECRQGYFNIHGMCVRHSQCPIGEGVLNHGTANQNTVCQICTNGTYSDIASDQQSCMPHQSCEAAGLKLVLKGSSWHNSVCASSEEIKSKDGAEYLKEILPTFFVHQKMNSRRLRQLVHKLTNGKTPTHHLGGSDCLAEINTWLASATVKELRDLPAVLVAITADNAGVKLQNKLHRIDSHLKGMYAENEENEVLPSGAK